MRTVPWIVSALFLSVPLLAVDASSQPTVVFVLHLAVLVGFAIGLSQVLVDLGTSQWFLASDWSAGVRLVASGVGLVVLVTGTVGLATLASSAALRFDPSTQFLQLISALDIAWVVAAITIGTHRAWGRSVSLGAGALVGGVCVWSIWMYLDHVGFGPNGEWIVSAPNLVRFVLPFDVVAAVTSVGVFGLGVSRSLSVGSAQTSEQPRLQS